LLEDTERGETPVPSELKWARHRVLKS